MAPGDGRSIQKRLLNKRWGLWRLMAWVSGKRGVRSASYHHQGQGEGVAWPQHGPAYCPHISRGGDALWLRQTASRVGDSRLLVKIFAILWKHTWIRRVSQASASMTIWAPTAGLQLSSPATRTWACRSLMPSRGPGRRSAERTSTRSLSTSSRSWRVWSPRISSILMRPALRTTWDCRRGSVRRASNILRLLTKQPSRNVERKTYHTSTYDFFWNFTITNKVFHF